MGQYSGGHFPTDFSQMTLVRVKLMKNYPAHISTAKSRQMHSSLQFSYILLLLRIPGNVPPRPYYSGGVFLKTSIKAIKTISYDGPIGQYDLDIPSLRPSSQVSLS